MSVGWCSRARAADDTISERGFIEHSTGVEIVELYKGDCLEIMRDIPDGSVDFILCDLPYGTTDCSWDEVIPSEKLWEQYNRIIKGKGTIALFGDFPFSANLIAGNIKNFKYAWYWRKNNSTGALMAKIRPLRQIEHILIFAPPDTSRDNAGKFESLREYMFTEREKTGLTRTQINALLGNQMSSHYFTRGRQFSIPSAADYAKLQSTGYFLRPYEELRAEWRAELAANKSDASAETFTYNPQGLKKLETPIINKAETKMNTEIYHAKYKKDSIQTRTGYPTNVLEFKNVGFGAEPRQHPTQKPVALLEYLIRTYTNMGETVLDNCMGSGSTGVACANTGRHFIGIEQNEEYFKIAQERIQEAESAIHMDIE